jgi:bifunctional non-homologous end joining protein LigD
VSDVALTNLERRIYPSGFTKGDVVEYYRAVAPALLPFLRDRAVTLFRAPSGVEARGWFQTNCTGAPAWMRVADVPGRGGARFHMCMFDDVRSLVWAAQTGTLELHPFVSRVTEPARPDWLVLDLDPGAPSGLPECCDVALALRERLGGRQSLVKTSGVLGLHVLVPVTGMTFPETKTWARELAAGIPGTVTTQKRSERTGRVLVDILQNDPTRSLVAPWSLRANVRPTVSTPLDWSEVERCAADRDPRPLVFDAPQALARLGGPLVA